MVVVGLEADLEEADLVVAELVVAELVAADLEEAELEEAELEEAELVAADLVAADLVAVADSGKGDLQFACPEHNNPTLIYPFPNTREHSRIHLSGNT